MNAILATITTALISSVTGAIVAAIVSKLKIANTATKNAKHEAAELKALMQQNILMTCRMAIYDDHFSVDEKLDAYKIYRSNGGNHQTKTYMDGVVGTDVDEYLEHHRREK